MEGIKHDSRKPRWDLLPNKGVEDIVRVLTFGAEKYADDNWQKVPDAHKRYYAAAMRHISAWRSGEINDPESGLPHLAHAGCCLLFLTWFTERNQSAQESMYKTAEEITIIREPLATEFVPHMSYSRDPNTF